MGILHVHAAATAHELQDIHLITEALEWFTESEWDVDMTTSYHGPKVAVLTTQIKKNKQIKQALQFAEVRLQQEMRKRMEG